MPTPTNRLVFTWLSTPATQHSKYLTLEVAQEDAGRFLAEVTDLPGLLACGSTEHEAVARVQSLSRGVPADRIENSEPTPSLLPLDSRAA